MSESGLHIIERVINTTNNVPTLDVHYDVMDGDIKVAQCEDETKAARLIDLIKKGRQAEMMHSALGNIQFNLMYCSSIVGSQACVHGHDALRILRETFETLHADDWKYFSAWELARIAIEMLAYLYREWENGVPSYEDPEHEDEYLGRAFKIDERLDDAFILFLNTYLPVEDLSRVDYATWSERVKALVPAEVLGRWHRRA